jgi:hypothetical protein
MRGRARLRLRGRRGRWRAVLREVGDGAGVMGPHHQVSFLLPIRSCKVAYVLPGVWWFFFFLFGTANQARAYFTAGEKLRTFCLGFGTVLLKWHLYIWGLID